MIFRELTTDNDWTFGKGRNNYLSGKKAVMANIKTRLQSFLGDCFFALADGIDWFTLLGSHDQISIELAISACILNTPDVTGRQALTTNLNPKTRQLTITYRVATIYGTITDDFIFDVGI